MWGEKMYKPKSQKLVDWILNGIDKKLAKEEWEVTIRMLSLFNLHIIEYRIIDNCKSNKDYLYQLESYVCQQLENRKHFK